MRKLSNRLISNSINPLKLISVLVLLMAAWLMTGALPAYAAPVRLCGSTGVAKDIGCGGTVMGGVGACGAGQYCCNETHTCGDSLMMTSCDKERDICQMPTVDQCTEEDDPTCGAGCTDGQYCCTHGMHKPSCDSNVIALEFDIKGCKLPKANICLQSATPTPTPTPTWTPTPTPSPTWTPTPTPTWTPTPSPSPSPTPSPTPTSTIFGSVEGGTSPVTGALVTLYAAGNSYGASPSPLATATTDGSGDFTVGYVPPSPAALLYLTANGGNAGGGTNTTIGLMGIDGPSASPEPSVSINELTTVSGEWALAQFTDSHGANIGSPLANATGLANAAAQAQANLADVTTGLPAAFWGTYNANEANCTGISPPVNCDGLKRMDTIANILADCIQSTSPFTDCSTLATNTDSVGDTTLHAAHDMATLPTSNLIALFALQADSGEPFAPYLSTVPSDGWEIALNLNPSGANFSHPNSIAIDANGDPWIPNSSGNTLTELTPIGAFAANYTASSPTGADFNDPVGVAVDTLGNIWITNNGDTGTGANSVTELIPGASPSPTPSAVNFDNTAVTGANFNGPYAIAIDPANNVWVTNLSGGIANSGSVTGFTSGSTLIGNFTSSSPTNADFAFPFAIAIDAANPFNVWVTNAENFSVTELAPGATPSPTPSATNWDNSTTTGTSDFFVPYGIALDLNGNIWVPNLVGQSVTKLTPLGVAVNYAPGGAEFAGPYGIAIDGLGNVWITNSNSTNLSELDGSGDSIASFDPTGAGFNSPISIAIDESGNIWITNNGGNSVAEFIGITPPVLTPLSSCLSATSPAPVCLPGASPTPTATPTPP